MARTVRTRASSTVRGASPAPTAATPRLGCCRAPGYIRIELGGQRWHPVVDRSPVRHHQAQEPELFAQHGMRATLMRALVRHLHGYAREMRRAVGSRSRSASMARPKMSIRTRPAPILPSVEVVVQQVDRSLGRQMCSAAAIRNPAVPGRLADLIGRRGRGRRRGRHADCRGDAGKQSQQSEDDVPRSNVTVLGSNDRDVHEEAQDTSAAASPSSDSRTPPSRAIRASASVSLAGSALALIEDG